jgi:predicted methyltransferase
MLHSIKPARWFSLYLLVVLAAGCAASSADYQAVLTNPDRPDAERKLDPVRKPQEVMAFYGVKRGDKVADLFAARGYYTAVLSQLVGPEGVSNIRACAMCASSTAPSIKSPCRRTVRWTLFLSISTITSLRRTRARR